MAHRFEQPLAGWWSHAAPFEFTHEYRPAPGIARYLCGTQPVLSMTALECGLDTFIAAEPFGGIEALRRKSLALTEAGQSYLRIVAPALDQLREATRRLRESRTGHVLTVTTTVSFADPTIPAWFTVSFDRRTLRPRVLHMTAAAHFMVGRYLTFNRPRTIRPPR